MTRLITTHACILRKKLIHWNIFNFFTEGKIKNKNYIQPYLCLILQTGSQKRLAKIGKNRFFGLKGLTSFVVCQYTAPLCSSSQGQKLYTEYISEGEKTMASISMDQIVNK
jgi:hypothetical protein